MALSFRVPPNFFAFFSTASECARNYWWQHQNHNRTHTFTQREKEREKVRSVFLFVAKVFTLNMNWPMSEIRSFTDPEARLKQFK